MTDQYPLSSYRKLPGHLGNTWRNFEIGLSSPPASPLTSWSNNPDLYLHLLQRAYLSLTQHSKDAGLLNDIQQFLTEHKEPSEDYIATPEYFGTVPLSPPSKNDEKVSIWDQQLDELKSQPATPVTSRRTSSSSYANFCTQLYDQMSETTSNTGTNCSAENLWNQFKRQIQDLQAENNNILSFVVDSEVKLKNAAANITYVEEEQSAPSIVTEEDTFEDEIEEMVTTKSRYSRHDTRLSYVDEVFPPSPTEVALRSLLKNCKEQESKRNVLDDTLSLLNRDYDDKAFRRDIRRILGTSSAGTRPSDDPEGWIDIMIRWLRFLVILFLSVIICILNGPSSLADQR
ncbi:hypothetical protein BGW37DRAFT_19367 [Umbelopsis sp. PMI_123]|nr:hypothetical protein BGW37DRAFT_19367 [Umbelopsis sp. PMI_123]